MPRRISLNVPMLLRSRVLFCAVLSVFMVGMRLGIFDYETFFQFHYFPGHDMYQGASFLTTSMHAMRLGGDIAWWNPASFNGYAQYYQSFFSPLAPTSGHIVFIIWAQGIRLLSGVGIAIPEYVQYLTINYIVFPFLAFFMLGCFASLIFRRRVAVFLVVLVYTLSAIGVWNSAWFYFQEPFTLFLLLTGVLAALKYPSRRTLFGLVGAGLIQFTSLNYWTLYNTWFVIVIVGSYCWIYPNQLKRCLLHIFSLLRLQRGLVALLAVGVVLTVSLWSVVLVSTAKEGANYIRTETSSEASTYTKIKAYERVAELRQYTTELFNPDIPNYDEMAQTFQKNTNAYNGRLFLHEKIDAALLNPPTAPSTASFSYEWTEWLYNSFGFKVVIPQDGWLRINQITDPNWNITIDGKPVSAYRANFMSTAFPISAGAHQIRMDYMPLARRVYWIAVLALEITLAFIAICVLWPRKRRIHSDRNAQTFFVQT